MLETLLAIFLLIIASELWVPLAFLLALFKLIFSLSLSAAWDEFASVPIWIWEFAHSLFLHGSLAYERHMYLSFLSY